MSTLASTCCSNPQTKIIFEIKNLPFFIGAIGEQTPSVLKDLNLPFSLTQCQKCNLIQQVVSPQLWRYLDLVYQSNHEASCSGTKTGQGDFGMARARNFFEAIGKMNLPNKVLEIGCNEGHVLDLCLSLGAKEAVGIEPSCKATTWRKPNLQIIPGFFTPDLLEGKKFDFALLIEVLEHIQNPIHFISEIGKAMEPNGELALSVPNCQSGFEFGNIGMPIHEHIIYFTPDSLRHTLKSAGFRPLSLVSSFSHLYCLAQFTGVPANQSLTHDALGEGFWNRTGEVIHRVNRFIEQTQSSPFGLYGACSLTTNLLAMAEEIDFSKAVIIDSDPNKWGLKLSGTQSTILSPQEALKQGVKEVLIMPFGFQENISDFLKTRFPEFKQTLLYPGMAEKYSRGMSHHEG